MLGHSEEYGNLSIEQKQVEGWVDGTYNTYIIYNYNKNLTIKYHHHATEREQHKIDPADTLYNISKGKDLIARCNFYKNLLNDIAYLKLKMTMKIKNGMKYKFDMGFVNDSLKRIVDVVHNDIQEIYMNLQFDAMSQGRQFFIPLPMPDYTIQNESENITENEQSTDIAIKDNSENETLEIIKKDTTLIIELLKNIQNRNTEPLPELESLNELTEDNDPVLRKWTNGKYKCTSLEEFVKRYIKIADNLTPALIRDYLISDKTGKQYSDNSIETAIKLYGPGRKGI
jgi:hypothetical protein